MFHKTLFCLSISVLYIIVVVSEDPLSSSENEEYFSITKNIQAIVEYLGGYIVPGMSKLLGQNDTEPQGAASGAGAVGGSDKDSDDVLSFDFAKYDRKVALTPEEVVEQILKVEHELDQYNDNSEL